MDASNLVNFLYVFVVVISGGFQGSYGFIKIGCRMCFSHGGACNHRKNLL